MPEDTVIEIYGRDNCPFCDKAKSLCDNKGYRYVYHDINSDETIRLAFEERSSNAKTVPQIFVGNHKLGGFDDFERIERAGVIQRMLGGK
jgi:glutaredoxin 3